MTKLLGYFTEPVEDLTVHKLSAVRIIIEGQNRGYKTFYFNVSGLFFEDGEVYANGWDIEFDLSRSEPPYYQLSNERIINLKELDILFLRKDPPPTSDEYITCSYLFEMLKNHVFMINNPRAVRSAHSKLLTLHYPEYIIPSLVCFSKKHILAFLEKHGDIVLKPLNELGGRGVLRLSKDDKNIQSMIDTMVTAYGELIAQKFIPEAITQGDKRIILFDGKPYGAIMRKPAENDFRSNITVGGSYERSELNNREKEICEKIGPYLRDQGLFFVGLDIIGGYITEINATSPGALAPANKVYDTPFEGVFWDVLEEKIKSS